VRIYFKSGTRQRSLEPELRVAIEELKLCHVDGEHLGLAWVISRLHMCRKSQSHTTEYVRTYVRTCRSHANTGRSLNRQTATINHLGEPLINRLSHTQTNQMEAHAGPVGAQDIR